MTLNVYFKDWCHINTNYYFHKINEYISQKYTDINFVHIDKQCFGGFECFTKIGPNLCVIENPINNKYTVISFLDSPFVLFEKTFWPHIEQLQQIFSCNNFTIDSYNNWKQTIPSFQTPLHYFESIENKLVPISFHPIIDTNEITIENVYKRRLEIKQFDDKVIFRGQKSIPFRGEVMDTLSHPNIIVTSERVPEQQFLDEQINNLCSLSLPGIGDMSCRDIELMGMGICMFRTPFHSSFDDPPIENVHYVKICDWDWWFLDGSYIKPIDVKVFNESLINLQQSIKLRYDEFLQISKNARQWYLKNCTRNSPNNTLEIFKRKFDINLLF
jgi:hypothetical protein